MYPPQPPQPPQQPYPQPQPDPNQPYPQPPYQQPPYAPPAGQEAYGMPPNPYAPPSTPMMQPPYAPPPPPNPYAPPSMPFQQPPNPYAPQQPMYGAPMAAPNALNFSAFTLPQNRGNLTAAIGGIVALLSFLVLPYYGISEGTNSLSYSASQLTNGTFGASGFLWFVPLLAAIAVVLACLVAFGNRSIRELTPRNAAYAILSSGGLGTLICLITLAAVNNRVSQETAGVNLSGFGVSYGFSLGFWLTLLAMIAVTVGGAFILRQTQTPPPMMPPYMGGGYPPQPPQMPPMPPMQ